MESHGLHRGKSWCGMIHSDSVESLVPVCVIWQCGDVLVFTGAVVL
jgi:hypothetical protein